MSAITTQIGGSHYKDLQIQPVEYIHANELGYFEGNVLKYITRWKSKGGIADLEKAKHYIELLIELEAEKQSVDAMEKPDESDGGWIEWNGGECPVDPEAMAQIITKDGDVLLTPLRAGRHHWKHIDDGSDIVAYRVVK